MILVRLWRTFGGPWPQGNFAFLGHILVGALAAIAAVIIGLITGTAIWPTVLIDAVMIGIVAVASHGATQDFGRAGWALTSTGQPQTTVGRTVSVLLPPLSSPVAKPQHSTPIKIEPLRVRVRDSSAEDLHKGPQP